MNSSHATTKRFLPAEWQPHQGTLVGFPPDSLDWPGKLGAARWAFVELIRRLALDEAVYLVVRSPAQRQAAAGLLRASGVALDAVSFIVCDTNRVWMRDCGPVLVRDAGGRREALQFRFTGWAKYRNHRKDQAVPAAVAAQLGLPLIPVTHAGRQVVLEGGAIDGNGAGTLLTTEECLLDPLVQVRNPGFGKAEYEAVFREFLGVTQTIWLGAGIAGDDTHGHVDDICRFVSPDTVVAAFEPDGRDPNHRPLAENLERLASARLADGRQPRVVRLPMPAPLFFKGMRLPASYANFIFTRHGLLVPTFNDPHDRLALGILAELLPDRQVCGIHAVDLVLGQGTLHCLTHELP